MSLTIEEMHLSPVMRQRASELERAFPEVICWTSGRRSFHEQARAMAVNHLLDPQAHMMNTYVHASEFLHALQIHQDADTVEEVAEVFYSLMVDDPTVINSPHLLGNAVDLRRMEDLNGEPTPNGKRVIAWIEACHDTVDFRRREGRRRIWHWSCTPSYAV